MGSVYREEELRKLELICLEGSSSRYEEDSIASSSSNTVCESWEYPNASMDEVLVFDTLLKQAMYMTRRIAIVSSMIPTAPMISICMSMSIKYFFWVKRKKCLIAELFKD